MRNAVICIVVMTALLLLWPVAFGPRDTGAAGAATVRMAVPPAVR